MNARIRYSAILLVASANLFSQSLTARDELNQGSVAFRQGKHNEAIQHYKAAVALEDGIGVIDSTQVFAVRAELRAKLGLKPDTPLISQSECWRVHAENLAHVEDGIEMLTKALHLRPDYDDAMAYLNLMYRQRADFQCGDKEAYNADIAVLADKWVDKAMEIKKAKAEKERSSAPPSEHR